MGMSKYSESNLNILIHNMSCFKMVFKLYIYQGANNYAHDQFS